MKRKKYISNDYDFFFLEAYRMSTFSFNLVMRFVSKAHNAHRDGEKKINDRKN